MSVVDLDLSVYNSSAQLDQQVAAFVATWPIKALRVFSSAEQRPTIADWRLGSPDWRCVAHVEFAAVVPLHICFVHNPAEFDGSEARAVLARCPDNAESDWRPAFPQWMRSAATNFYSDWVQSLVDRARATFSFIECVAAHAKHTPQQINAVREALAFLQQACDEGCGKVIIWMPLHNSVV